jgi:hypothetical protein
MPDGSKWGVDVQEIAWNRAKYYAHEFDRSVKRSLSEDTLPLFKAEPYEIQDWAENNMNWEDFKEHYLIESAPSEVNFNEGWITGDKEIKQY